MGTTHPPFGGGGSHGPSGGQSSWVELCVGVTFIDRTRFPGEFRGRSPSGRGGGTPYGRGPRMVAPFWAGFEETQSGFWAGFVDGTHFGGEFQVPKLFLGVMDRHL